MKSSKSSDRLPQGRRKRNVSNYGSGLMGRISRLVLLLVVTTGVNAGFIFFIRMFWHAYMSTPTGQKFAVIFAGEAEIISDMVSRDIGRLSFELSMIAFAVILTVGIACRLLHIMRYLYIPRGVFGRFALWGLPITAAVAIVLQNKMGITSWRCSYFFAFVPTMCLFFACFGMIYRFIPEIGDILQWTKNVKHNKNRSV